MQARPIYFVEAAFRPSAPKILKVTTWTF